MNMVLNIYAMSDPIYTSTVEDTNDRFSDELH